MSYAENKSAMRPILYKQDCGSPALLLSCGKHREQLQQKNYSTGTCYRRAYTLSKDKGEYARPLAQGFKRVYSFAKRQCGKWTKAQESLRIRTEALSEIIASRFSSALVAWEYSHWRRSAVQFSGRVVQLFVA